jgi:diphthamide biosynthesis methyltransferase
MASDEGLIALLNSGGAGAIIGLGLWRIAVIMSTGLDALKSTGVLIEKWGQATEKMGVRQLEQLKWQTAELRALRRSRRDDESEPAEDTH